MAEVDVQQMNIRDVSMYMCKSPAHVIVEVIQVTHPACVHTHTLRCQSLASRKATACVKQSSVEGKRHAHLQSEKHAYICF